MSTTVNKKNNVQKLLEDTGQAYTLMCQSHTNSDFADFAGSQALGSFREVLGNPDLTYDDLCVLLRKASNRASTRHCKTPWSTFMANYVAKRANNDVITGETGRFS